MSEQKTISVGAVKKLHGVDGRIRVQFDYPLVGDRLSYLIIKGLPYFIKHMKEVGQDEFLIRFEEIASREDAKRLIGSEVELKEKEAENQFDLSEEAYPDILGFKAFDQSGQFIGEILEFREMPMQTLLVLKLEETEILVPFLDETIQTISEDESKVSLQIPEGLIDLYL